MRSKLAESLLNAIEESQERRSARSLNDETATVVAGRSRVRHVNVAVIVSGSGLVTIPSRDGNDDHDDANAL